MKDLLYVGATFAFFGLMIGYVKACARLGTAKDDGSAHEPR